MIVRSSPSRAAPDERRHGCDELTRVDRLGEMHFKAAPERTRPIFRSRERRERRGRNVPNRRCCRAANPRDEFEPVHLWHAEIDDQDIGLQRCDHVRVPRPARPASSRLRQRSRARRAAGRARLLRRLSQGREYRSGSRDPVKRGLLLRPRMFARLTYSAGVHNHQRQTDAECRSMSFALAGHVHRPAMHLDDVAHDGRVPGQARPSCASCRHRLDGNARRRTGGNRPGCRSPCHSRRFPRASSPVRRGTCTRPFFGVNFTAFDNRFQTTCCSRSGSPDTGPTPWIDDGLHPDTLRVGGGLHRGDGVVNDDGQFDRLDVQPDLA